MFDYLSTTADVNRFVFYVAIGFCVLQAAIEIYKVVRRRN